MNSDPFGKQVDEFREKIRDYLNSASQKGLNSQVDIETLQTQLSVMIEELQIAGEELHQENEQLYQAQLRLAEESQNYQTLFQRAPDAYLVTTGLGVVIEANQAASDLLRVPLHHIAGRPVALFFRGQDLQELLTHIRTLPERGGRDEWEARLLPRGKPPIDVLISLVVQNDAPDQERRLLFLIRDVSAHREAERALHESQARFTTIFEAAEIGIVLMDLHGKILEGNPAFQLMSGYNTGDLRKLHFQEIIPAEQSTPEQRQLAGLFKGEKRQYDLEHELHCKSGEEIWVHSTMTLLPDRDGKPAFVLGLFEDITLLRRRNEEVIELERQIEESSDRERETLARDLHDGPLQQVLSMMFKLQVLIRDHPNEDFVSGLEELKQDAQQVVDVLRMTSGLMRSPILARFGLDRAIESYIDQARMINPDVKIKLDLRDSNWVPSGRVQQGVYRILQHTLINALRHGSASQVSVRLFRSGNQLLLEVEDNGKGFAVPKRWVDLTEDGHYGLIGSAERAAMLGGVLRLHSKPGEGTLVQASIPVLEEAQRKHTLTDLDPEIPVF